MTGEDPCHHECSIEFPDANNPSPPGLEYFFTRRRRLKQKLRDLDTAFREN
jgi:hypothetical protein